MSHIKELFALTSPFTPHSAPSPGSTHDMKRTAPVFCASLSLEQCLSSV